MRLFFTTILIVLSSIVFSQNNITGSWYGKAEAIANGINNSYLTELIIKQKGNEVTGIFGYYFRDGYKSVFIRGTYDNKTRKLEINNIPVTYFKAPNIDGVDCPMDMSCLVMVSKVKTTLKGSLFSHDKYRYTCPELSFSYTLDNSENNQDSLIKNSITKKLWQPQPQDVIVTATPKAAKMQDTVVEKPTLKFDKRTNIIAQQIEISSDSLRISFYDNGDIDGDSISVFLNNVPILTKQELTAEATTIYIKLDNTVAINEITMYAENLGKYPPNTALMVINDGIKRHEVYLSSSLTNNATVRLIRKK